MSSDAFLDLPTNITTMEHGIPGLILLRHAQKHGYRYTMTKAWPRMGKFNPALVGNKTLYVDRSSGTHIGVFECDNAVVRITHTGGSFYVTAYGVTETVAESVIDKIRELFPKDIVVTEDQAIPMSFWFLTDRGPNEWTRRISVPGWETIRENYVVAPELDNIIKWEIVPEGVSGKLLLWYGPPGTGKTYAIRALGWEWRKWCTLEYITDPERFFGSAAYMMQVLMEGDEKSKSRLLVCEDVGELMMADAKERAGQSLSRLLNLTEGLIGQGMKVMVLFTTNEEIKSLHPAIRRPGRSLMNLGFTAFKPDDATAWLRARGENTIITKDTTLAELYSRVAHHDVIQTVGPARRTVGFGQPSKAARTLELEVSLEVPAVPAMATE